MRLAAGLAGAVLAAGCGILPGPVPEWVANRQPLESCGEEVLDQGEPHDQAVRGCLLQAFEEGRGAELISSQPTIEGDPITRYVRVHENGVVEIFVDATRDRFGSGRWERIVCDDLVPVEDASDPPDLVFPAEMVFVENGCEELPLP
jgi:hypothetical protein